RRPAWQGRDRTGKIDGLGSACIIIGSRRGYIEEFTEGRGKTDVAGFASQVNSGGHPRVPYPASRCQIMPKPTDICITAIEPAFEDFHYRTRLKFGGVAADRVTILNVHSQVSTVSGKTAKGFGSMPLGNIWSFPSKSLTYDQTVAAMKALAERIARLTADCK